MKPGNKADLLDPTWCAQFKNIPFAGQLHILCHRCSSDALLRELRARPRACLPCWGDRDSEPQNAKLPVAPCLPFVQP